MVDISVVVPFHNAGHTLARCLESVAAVSDGSMEVILVDDGSTDGSSGIARGFSYRLLGLTEKSGAAVARNRGAAEARGEYLLFLDADVVLRLDTIRVLRDTFRQRPEIAAVGGVYSDRPLLPGLFQEFKALESAYNYSRYRTDRYSAFDTHCSMVRRDSFFELGGFPESYRGADVEDVHFGRLLAERYVNCINPAAVVDHHYSRYWSGLEKYLRRTFYWVRLFLAGPQFDEAVTTRHNALSVLLAGCTVAAAALGIWHGAALWVAGVLLAAFVLWNCGFWRGVVVRRGWRALWKVPVFLLYLFTLQVAVAVGAAGGLIWWSLRPASLRRGSRHS